MPELIPLFSKPIYISSIDIDPLDLSEIDWAKNFNNSISKNQNILSHDKFSAVLSCLSTNINDYFYGVLGVAQQTEIFITESWLNKTEKGQSHHRHWHPNSIISGIIYLQGDEKSGHTKFITGQYDLLEFEITQPNLYNSKSWSIEPIRNRVIIFPSNLEHLVEEYTGEIPRITLSFNTFVNGTINSLPLTRLSF